MHFLTPVHAVGGQAWLFLMFRTHQMLLGEGQQAEVVLNSVRCLVILPLSMESLFLRTGLLPLSAE